VAESATIRYLWGSARNEIKQTVSEYGRATLRRRRRHQLVAILLLALTSRELGRAQSAQTPQSTLTCSIGAALAASWCWASPPSATTSGMISTADGDHTGAGNGTETEFTAGHRRR